MLIESHAIEDLFPIFEFNNNYVNGKFDIDHSESTFASYNETSYPDGFMSMSFSCKDDDTDFDFFSPSVSAVPSKAKKVSFGGVTVREFMVVVGCNDSIDCPLELGWEYVESTLATDGCYKSNSKPRSRMRPLSYRERKERIAVTQDVPICHVKFLEQEMLAMLSNCIIKCKNLPIPVIHVDCKNAAMRRALLVDSPPRHPREKQMIG
jgi:hypothetical protein